MSPHPTGKGADFGLNFLYENRFKKAWAYTGDSWAGALGGVGGSLLGEHEKTVPAADHTCWLAETRFNPQTETPFNGYYGPCPRTKAGDEVYNHSRLSGFGVVECWKGEPVVLARPCFSLNCTYHHHDDPLVRYHTWDAYYGPCPASDANSLM